MKLCKHGKSALLLKYPGMSACKLGTLRCIFNIKWLVFLLAAYLELLLLHYYGFSQDDDETPAKRLKLENGTAKIGRLSIITPVNPAERGCQLSVKFSIPVKSLREELDKRGVVVRVRRSKQAKLNVKTL